MRAAPGCLSYRDLRLWTAMTISTSPCEATTFSATSVAESPCSASSRIWARRSPVDRGPPGAEAPATLAGTAPSLSVRRPARRPHGLRRAGRSGIARRSADGGRSGRAAGGIHRRCLDELPHAVGDVDTRHIRRRRRTGRGCIGPFCRTSRRSVRKRQRGCQVSARAGAPLAAGMSRPAGPPCPARPPGAPAGAAWPPAAGSGPVDGSRLRTFSTNASARAICS